MTSRRTLLIGLMLIVAMPCGLAGSRAEAGGHSADTPASRDEMKWWLERHEQFNERAKRGDVDLVFIGDSITQGWESDGKAAWDKHFVKLKPMNLGISGDRTQNVLWRLDHGNLEGVSPKVAVVMIGTNNSNAEDNTAEEIADGVKAIVQKLRSKLPKTKVLLLAIFPRGEKIATPGGPPGNPQRDKIAKANKLAAQVADGEVVHYLDIGDNFLDDGEIPKAVMPDLVHLSPKGYEIWAEAIAPKVAELMGDKK